MKIIDENDERKIYITWEEANQPSQVLEATQDMWSYKGLIYILGIKYSIEEDTSILEMTKEEWKKATTKEDAYSSVETYLRAPIPQWLYESATHMTNTKPELIENTRKPDTSDEETKKRKLEYDEEKPKVRVKTEAITDEQRVNNYSSEKEETNPTANTNDIKTIDNYEIDEEKSLRTLRLIYTLLSNKNIQVRMDEREQARRDEILRMVNDNTTKITISHKYDLLEEAILCSIMTLHNKSEINKNSNEPIPAPKDDSDLANQETNDVKRCTEIREEIYKLIFHTYQFINKIKDIIIAYPHHLKIISNTKTTVSETPLDNLYYNVNQPTVKEYISRILQKQQWLNERQWKTSNTTNESIKTLKLMSQKFGITCETEVQQYLHLWTHEIAPQLNKNMVNSIQHQQVNNSAAHLIKRPKSEATLHQLLTKAKFDRSWRYVLHHWDNKVVILQGPNGCGKTIVANSLQLWNHKNWYKGRAGQYGITPICNSISAPPYPYSTLDVLIAEVKGLMKMTHQQIIVDSNYLRPEELLKLIGEVKAQNFEPVVVNFVPTKPEKWDLIINRLMSQAVCPTPYSELSQQCLELSHPQYENLLRERKIQVAWYSYNLTM